MGNRSGKIAKSAGWELSIGGEEDHFLHLGPSVATPDCPRSNHRMEEEGMALSKDLLEILACPKCVRDPGCTGELEYREKENQLICHHCRLIYRIEDDIPIMLIDEALPLEK